MNLIYPPPPFLLELRVSLVILIFIVDTKENINMLS